MNLVLSVLGISLLKSELCWDVQVVVYFKSYTILNFINTILLPIQYQYLVLLWVPIPISINELTVFSKLIIMLKVADFLQNTSAERFRIMENVLISAEPRPEWRGRSDPRRWQCCSWCSQDTSHSYRYAEGSAFHSCWFLTN